MEKEIYKVVFTGGPSAGKSSVLSKAIQAFSSFEDVRVFVISETPTNLIYAGIKPFGNCLDINKFQDYVYEMQSFNENLFMKAAMDVPEKKILILLDRGIFDAKAYFSNPEDFDKMLIRHSQKPTQLLNSIDLVLHLVTAADGAEEFYEWIGSKTCQNKARTEPPEVAIELDKKTKECYLGCPNLRVIDNSTDFETKKQRAINEIASLLSVGSIPNEISKKYLVTFSTEFLNNLKAFKKIDIQQSYLKKIDEYERRIRKRGNFAEKDISYFYSQYKTVKQGETLERIKTDKIISETEYNRLLLERDLETSIIRKERYCFISENQYFNLDKFDFDDEKAILEIRLSNVDGNIMLPEGLEVIKDVTDDNTYTNYGISRRNFL